MIVSGARAESPKSAEALAEEVERLRAQVADLTERLAAAERLADRDTLTPLLNRRAFMAEVQRAIAVARRHQIPASVIYFDMDGFKAVNDRFGHAAGDAALIAVAERLLDQVRESDVVGRLGGDEFAVLLLHADREAAAHKAQSLSAKVSGAPVKFQGASFPVSVTYGVREVQGADSPEQALAEADAMMYLRKPPKG
ncbi:MAG TPA: GGDEF domain-containing protein [Caulobacteraceae bacterium]|nr:GGDEF domain-containing protein [Caulobacteraceae bacterium]